MPRILPPLPALRMCLAVGLVVAGSAQAQSASQALHLKALAATCANCHGTDGRAVDGAGSIPLRGLGKDYIVAQMTAFREGKRAATVMHQLAKGYTPEQVEQLAAYFAAQN
ncbi:MULTISPECIES: c-type cytochrome [unclassified Methylibium]|uniref:c-type cytochrome n=1 Tax=unclassified Methylibium TaxID=2633235 RepID=UPI0003F3DAAE|nr:MULTISPECIES: c-type cytochrome [unclassified Methylibium]EWS56064.1 Flavocytochrome c cytochrome subunit [Methylibium sp. T29]EWS60451.1 Flavocytochrome c cytochrome subunit [Methylibium sp. T29-B]